MKRFGWARSQEGNVLVENREWTIVDDHFGGKRADVEHRCLAECGIAAEATAGLLTNQKELTLKSVAAQSFASCNDQHFDVWLTRLGRWTDVCPGRLGGNDAPADKPLALRLDDFLHSRFAFRALGFELRQKDNSGSNLPWRRQFCAELFAGDPTKEFVRQCREDASAVARVRFAATRAAVVHVAKHFLGINENLMTPLSLDIGDKAHTARIVLESRIV
jgi:hypothetical protein